MWDVSVVELKEQLNLNEQEIYLALGWLTRADKVMFPNRQPRSYNFIEDIFIILKLNKM